MPMAHKTEKYSISVEQNIYLCIRKKSFYGFCLKHIQEQFM